MLTTTLSLSLALLAGAGVMLGAHLRGRRKGNS